MQLSEDLVTSSDEGADEFFFSYTRVNPAKNCIFFRKPPPYVFLPSMEQTFFELMPSWGGKRSCRSLSKRVNYLNTLRLQRQTWIRIDLVPRAITWAVAE